MALWSRSPRRQEPVVATRRPNRRLAASSDAHTHRLSLTTWITRAWGSTSSTTSSQRAWSGVFSTRHASAGADATTGRTVASGGEDGTVRLWDPRGRRVMRTLKGHEGEISRVVFTPDGRFLLSSGRDRTVRVWDLRRGKELRSLAHPAAVHGLALTPLFGF